MKLLVTGGAGYIGSVVATQLLSAGHEVVVLDNLDTGHRDAVPEGATYVQARIDEAEDVLADGIEAVVHFAAKSLVGESVAAPEIYWRNNVVGSLALLDAMRRTGVGRIVFSSTAATYGEPDVSPITEDTPAVPINPYGQTKLAVDNMLSGEAAAHGLAAVSLRYFNVGGAFADRGERHVPETHLIPNVLAVATGDREQVAIFGTDYPTRDGTAVRDYLHVEDLGRAHLLALEKAVPGEHLICNLGTGTGYTVREVVQACRTVTGHAIPAVEQPRRAGDPPELVASNARAAERLGWTVEHGLEQIVTDAWDFISST
ncbi:MAG: UDP-glucose 4-epimerase GalE [Jiangellales bacterium]